MQLYEQIFVAACLVMPREPEPADALFLPGRALGDWEEGDGNQGLLQRAREIFSVVGPLPIVLNGQANLGQDAKPIPTSYVGPEPWEQKLIKLGIPSDHLIRTAGGQHTGTECIAYVECARDREWTSAMVLVNHHQLLRTMMIFIKAMARVGYPLKITPVVPKYISWTTDVYGSQGAEQLPRWLHAVQEAQRIQRYLGSEFMSDFGELETHMLMTQ